MTWNHEIDTAPRGHNVKSTRTVKGKFQEVTDFEPDHVWLATKCGKVLKSYWIPEAGKIAARWSGLATGEHPVAWCPYIVPEHPGALTALERIQAKLITTKHTFVDDVGGGV